MDEVLADVEELVDEGMLAASRSHFREETEFADSDGSRYELLELKASTRKVTTYDWVSSRDRML